MIVWSFVITKRNEFTLVNKNCNWFKIRSKIWTCFIFNRNPESLKMTHLWKCKKGTGCIHGLNLRAWNDRSKISLVKSLLKSGFTTFYISIVWEPKWQSWMTELNYLAGGTNFIFYQIISWEEPFPYISRPKLMFYTLNIIFKKTKFINLTIALDKAKNV